MRRNSFPGSWLARRMFRRRLLRPRQPRWLNATAGLSILALVGIALLGALLSRRGGAGDAADLADFARRDGVPPAQLILDGARTQRIVVLGDVPGSGAAKRVAAEAVERMALGPGLDALVLDVDRGAQPYIDAYLEAPAEDASILLAHPETTPGGSADDYLPIYRRVWQLNQKLGADRAITIVAAGLAGWPPAGALAPRAEAELYARRGPAMAQAIEQHVFARIPRGRVLVFVDGYQALKSGYGALAAGGGSPVQVQWLAALLTNAHPGEVYSVLQDGPPGGLREGPATTFTGTRAYQIFHDAAQLHAPFGLAVGQSFHFLRQPIVTTSSPGTQLTIEPDDYRLGDVVDGYIYLGPH
ncbi:MAG TPA: hypothetical protein VF832_16165 [Longimicrobiales bacterium]